MADASAIAPAVKSLADLKTVDDLISRVKFLQDLRRDYEIQWRLNLAFYRGKQYAYRVPNTTRIATVPVDDGEKPRSVVRLVSNQIMPGTQNLLAKYLKTKPRFFAVPGSGADADMKAAQMAELLLENWWDDMHLLDKAAEALMWGIVCSSGFWKITWDQHAGKSMKFLLDPQGQPIVDASLADLFRAQLKQEGLDSRQYEKVVYMGDVAVEAMGPDKVYLDPNCKGIIEEARYAICIHDLDPDEVMVRWGKKVSPDTCATQMDVSLPYGNKNGPARTLKRIYSMYVVPQPAVPDGRYLVWCDGADKQILMDSKWDLPTNDLPIVKFPGFRVPGSTYDSSPVEQALPLQKELNRTLSQIVQYKNLTIKPRVWAPVGSLRQRITNEAGAVYEYQPIGGLKPEVEQLPQLPPYVFEHLADIKARIDDIFGNAQIDSGTPPPNVEAGIAIDLLQEMATDRIAPTVQLIEHALGRAGRLMLAYAQEYYSEPRLLKLRGSNGSVQVKRFTQADIAGSVTIHVEAGSGLPRTRAGREARILNLVDRQIIPADRAWKHLDMADLKGLSDRFARSEDKALREHDKLIDGKPLNPSAQQQAVQQLQQGLNPETGQPLTPQDDPQAIARRAALQPTAAEDYQTHIEIHSDFINSIEYEALPLEVQQLFIDHLDATRQAWFSMPQMPQPESVRTSLQLKAAANAPEVVKILERAGVRMTPEESMAPPIETWITDSVDKPDTDAAGAGQEGKQLADTAKALIDAQTSHAAAAQQLQHAGDLHTHAVRKAKAEADLAVKKAKQGPPKPSVKPR